MNRDDRDDLKKYANKSGRIRDDSGMIYSSILPVISCFFSVAYKLTGMIGMIITKLRIMRARIARALNACAHTRDFWINHPIIPDPPCGGILT